MHGTLKSLRFTFIFIVAILCQAVTKAQQDSSLVRPKIGLVLSGGGAKGLAHIRVLK